MYFKGTHILFIEWGCLSWLWHRAGFWDSWIQIWGRLFTAHSGCAQYHQHTLHHLWNVCTCRNSNRHEKEIVPSTTDNFFSPCTETLCLQWKERRFSCVGAPRREENQVSLKSCSTEMWWDSLGSLSTDRGVTEAQGARQPEDKSAPNHFSLESLRSQHGINWKIQRLPQMPVNTDYCPFLNPLSWSFL